jgi:hypothetical protein
MALLAWCQNTIGLCLAAESFIETGHRTSFLGSLLASHSINKIGLFQLPHDTGIGSILRAWPCFSLHLPFCHSIKLIGPFRRRTIWFKDWALEPRPSLSLARAVLPN